jgi:hypothetical protein
VDRGYHGKGFCAAADMGSSGLSALIRTGAELSLEFEMEPLSCGSVGDADYALEIAGRHLVFRIALQGAENRLAAALMDGDGTTHKCWVYPTFQKLRFKCQTALHDVTILDRPNWLFSQDVLRQFEMLFSSRSVFARVRFDVDNPN